ncbi:DUF4240 domain-containing protein [Kitasatospora sp. NPDC058478]|uniref:DUF4240 domain-containing protein n=1 Tax=unclassified Kitasatospora TaxID=2633591 RepID=UPI003649631D
MGFEGGVWRLVRGEELVGEIVVEETDFPWLHGRFVPGTAFPAVQPLFARSLALSEAEDWEAFDDAYDEITSTVSMLSPSGPVAEFLLHIQGDRAWFRWNDEPFEDADGQGGGEAGSAGPSAGSDVDGNLGLDLPVMTWERFWQLIEVLGGGAGIETCEHLETACACLVEVLACEPLGQIIGFGERLAEALHRLDQEQFGTLPITGAVLPDGSPFPQSSDHFLYARAAVVAAGRDVYESMFHDPERFAPFTARQCEPLLYVHEEAFEQVTGTEWDRLTRYDYESCSNADGWPELRG